MRLQTHIDLKNFNQILEFTKQRLGVETLNIEGADWPLMCEFGESQDGSREMRIKEDTNKFSELG